MDKERFEHIASLHQHWIAADSLSYHLRRSLSGPDENSKMTGVSQELLNKVEHLSGFNVISVWYAMLYVVVEGYKELAINDNDIDALLANEANVNMLRRFRNSIFHYQKELTPDKRTEFITAEETEKWIRNLNSAFKKYFERTLNIKEVWERLNAMSAEELDSLFGARGF